LGHRVVIAHAVKQSGDCRCIDCYSCYIDGRDDWLHPGTIALSLSEIICRYLTVLLSFHYKSVTGSQLAAKLLFAR